MRIWSVAFVAEAGEGVDEMCFLGVAAWRELHEEYSSAKRLFAQIKCGESTIHCALGNPLRNGEEEDSMYLHPRLLEALGIEGIGEEAEVLWLTEEAFPAATKILLRPHDSAFYHVDAKEELEREFTRRGILEQGQTIRIPLEALGGYEVDFDVVKLEPANIVLAEGEEVEIEFEEALDAAAVAASPQPLTAATPMAEDFGAVIPVISSAQPPGQQLGGEIRYTADGRRWNPWRDGPLSSSCRSS
jgi:hypothetical protein